MQFVRSARSGDVIYLAPRLRAADLQEIQATSGLRPQDALQMGLWGSHTAFTTLGVRGQPVGMGGVLGAPERPGLIWYLATPEIEDTPITFLRQSKSFVDSLPWPELHAHSDNRNTVHQRWLEWVGFIPLYAVSEWGKEQRPFTFYRKTQQHV